VCLSAVCRARDRVPSGRVTPSRAQQVKAAQVEERSGRGALVLARTLCYTGDPAREARYGTSIETFQVFAPHVPYALSERAVSLKAQGLVAGYVENRVFILINDNKGGRRWSDPTRKICLERATTGTDSLLDQSEYTTHEIAPLLREIGTWEDEYEHNGCC